MPTNADDQQTPASASTPPVPPAPAPASETDVVDEALRSEARPAAEPAEPPVLSGRGMLRKGFLRWLLTGMIRVTYRQWTRLAVRLFPEDSRRAEFATRIGIQLPDRLNMSWITPHLAVGGRVLPGDIPRLARTGITRVVDTRSEKKDDVEALGREGIELLYLPTPDTFPLSVEQLRQGARWINEQIAQGERVLVHCEHGVGRSVLLTASALVAGGSRQSRWPRANNQHRLRCARRSHRLIPPA